MRAWLELLRISNLPTVWTNVLAGGVIADTAAVGARSWGFPAGTMIVVLISGSCLYLAGMVLNDVFDLKIDRQERPNRPIPSGRISRRSAAMLGTILLVVGASLAWTISIETGITALVIAGLVVLYERIHATTSWSVLVMAACRAGLYVMAGFAVVASSVADGATPDPETARNAVGFSVLIAIPAFVHVACFSLIARFEVPDVRETCPECEQIVLSDHAVCPECAAACGPEQRTERASSRLQRLRSWCGSGTLVLLLPFLGCCGLFGLVSISDGAPYAFGMSEHRAFLLVGANLVSILILGAYLVRSKRGLAEKPHEVGRFVLRSIAVLSLYDAAICGLVALEGFDQKDDGLLTATIICITCFLIVRWSHRRIPGT